MTSFELAAVVAAGTAFVLAPIAPGPLHNPCRLHLDAAAVNGRCLGCAKEQRDLAEADHARVEAELSARVRIALGLPGYPPAEGDGETARRVGMWSQFELNAVYERVGGTVTTRTVQRTSSDGTTWEATEITVTVDLPDVGTVEVFTDWYEEYGGRDLPLMQAVPDVELISV